MNFDHWDTEIVEQNNWSTCSRDTALFYTEGLANCIGACIAWGHWAALLHVTDAQHHEDEFRAIIDAALNAIPENERSRVRPVLCGAEMVSDEASQIDHADIVRSRARALELMTIQGFGDPIAIWSPSDTTAALFVDLKDSIIHIEHDEDIIRSYDIPQP